MTRLGLFAQRKRERREVILIRNCRIKVRFHIDIHTERGSVLLRPLQYKGEFYS